MNYAQIEKQIKKTKELEQHLNYYYNPRAVCIKSYSKHQYIQELMKDLKYDIGEIYEHNPFKKYVNDTLKKDLDLNK